MSSPEALRELETELQTELVPGTEVMRDVGSHYFIKSRRHDTVLVPQPSDSPHDPLNWNPLWKASAIATATVVTFAQNMGPLAIAPIFPELVVNFHSDLESVMQFTGVTILVLGFSNLIWVPLSETFGRRFVLITSTALNIASAVWRAEATSYNNFMGAAILAGFGAAPGEAIQPSIIADLMFLHERGFYNALYFVFFYSSLMLGSILQGTMAKTVGWRSFWWLMVAINSLALVAVLFGLPETKWNRASETEHTQPVRSVSSTEKGSEQTRGIKSKGLDTSSGEQHDSAQPNQQASVHGIGKPALYQFRFFQPTLDPIQLLLYSFFLPLRLFCYPIVQFASFIVSFSSACYLIVTFVQAEALGVPPYKFDSLTIGFTNFASLVGAFIGLATAGPASDWISAQLTRRNNGVREPEMRLLTIVPYAAVMLLGTFVVGFGLQYEWDWRAIIVVGFGCVGIQVAALPAIAATYAIDSYKPAAGSIFVSITINKNVWGYGVSRFVTPWILQAGYVAPVMLNGALLFLWCCFGALFWVYGKRLRRWTSRSSLHHS